MTHDDPQHPDRPTTQDDPDSPEPAPTPPAAPEAAPSALAPARNVLKDPAHRWLRRVLLYSVLGGLCPLSPIPFIDDIAIRFIRRAMIRKLFALQSIDLTDPQLNALTAYPEKGFLLGCCTAVLIYPLKKIFRKVFYFLAVKDCVDIASDLLHQGLILQYALTSGRFSTRDFATGTEASVRLNRAVLKTLAATDPSPINQLLKRSWAGSRVLLKASGGALARLIKRIGLSPKNPQADAASIEDAELVQDPGLNSFVDELTEAVWSKDGYRAELERRFSIALQEVDQADASPPEKG